MVRVKLNGRKLTKKTPQKVRKDKNTNNIDKLKANNKTKPET